MTTTASVLGSPISHSLSPVLHNTAYQELGLDIEYTAVHTSSEQLPQRISELGCNNLGYSLTMPLKLDVLTLVSNWSPVVRQTECANTVYRNLQGKWALENTDVFGITKTIELADIDVLQSATIIGSGATARSALSALGNLGVREITCIARNEASAQIIRLQGDALGIDVDWVGSARGIAFDGELVISTVPGQAQDRIISAIGARQNLPALLDIAYDPWPSELAGYWKENGGELALSGLEMLLWQATVQVELFTGLAAPIDAMRSALREKLSTT